MFLAERLLHVYIATHKVMMDFFNYCGNFILLRNGLG